jgi:hypothetical protein
VAVSKLSPQGYARARAALLADPIPELDRADAAAVEELSRLGGETPWLLAVGVQAVPPTAAQIADHHRRWAYALVCFADRHAVITQFAAWAIERWQEAEERAAADPA